MGRLSANPYSFRAILMCSFQRALGSVSSATSWSPKGPCYLPRNIMPPQTLFDQREKGRSVKRGTEYRSGRGENKPQAQKPTKQQQQTTPPQLLCIQRMIGSGRVSLALIALALWCGVGASRLPNRFSLVSRPRSAHTLRLRGGSSAAPGSSPGAAPGGSDQGAAALQGLLGLLGGLGEIILLPERG